MSKHTHRTSKLRQIDRLAIPLQRGLLAEFRRFRREASSKYPDQPNLLKHKKNLAAILSRLTVATRRTTYLSAWESFLKGGNVPLETKLDTEEQLRRRVQQWSRSNSLRNIANDIGDTTIARIKIVIEDGLADDDSPDDIARQIESAAEDDDVDMRRARMIARTETHSAVMGAEHDSMEDAADELGMTMFKVWLSSNDPRTRETHAEANGQKVALDDNFSVGEAELAYPGDPDGPPEEVINCRCVLTYEPA